MKKLVIISETIRRDLHAPLRYLTNVEVLHLYKNAGYGDMIAKDFISPKAAQYKNNFVLYSKIKFFQPDILQVPEPIANKTTFFASLVCLAYWFFYRAVLIMPCFENRPFEQKINKIKLFLMKFIYTIFSGVGCVFMVLNSGAKQNLVKLAIPENKIRNIFWGSWGINLNEFKFIPQTKSEKLKAKKILFLGRVSKAKGIPELLKAFKIVKAGVSNAQLIVAGPKGDASHLIPNRAASGMEVLGPIKNKQVPKLLNSVGILAMPSQSTRQWEEQVGMSGLQALACGVPVVTTYSGAIPEYFKNAQGAILVNEKDVQALAQAMEKLLTDKKFYREQSRLARNYIEGNFDLEERMKIVNEFLAGL